MDAALLEDFGQRVDLTRRIREVLVNYPEGTTVLKELIQNADDAGATKVCLCLDRREHGTESLLTRGLAQWQGPALLAYNNAVFTEEDFVSISRIGDSKKHSQAWKTGRFGVGFNSVYHLTDLPSFVSNNYVVLFDPQGAYLPNISASNPGKRLEFASSSAITLYQDQFFPYCAFGCDMKKPFNGTLFRLPLRNAEQAAVSKLSRQTYLEDDIFSLFSQLYKEVTLIMLFLKSITEIEMYTWDTGTDKPQKLYSCSINSMDESTIWHRQALLRLSNLTQSVDKEIDSFHLDLMSEEVNGNQSVKKITTFFIVQSMASTSSNIGRFAAAAANEHDLHLLPWASVAACITDKLSEDDVLKQGRAFCFLPLPVRTGLAVQVNGYFEVSSNRRSIWFGDDMDRGGKLRSDWNNLLLRDVVAPAFSELLLCLRKQSGPTKLYYSLWPTGTFEEPWNILVDFIYQNICQLPVTYSDLKKGIWMPPAEAFIHDDKYSESYDICATLLILEMPVVHLPKFVIKMLSQYLANFDQRVICPATVRNFLRNNKAMVEKLSRYNKLLLLEYCLSDLIDANVGKSASGLPLLPLASGEFGTFTGPSKVLTFFVCNNELEYQLLEPVSDKVIDQNIPSTLFNKLSAVAMTSQANIAFFDIHFFLQFLPRFFPYDWKYKNMVPWVSDTGDSNPSTSWFLLFWQYIQDHCLELSVFDDWPIFPSLSGHLYRASKFSKLINVENLPDSVKNLLVKIGCKILNPNYGVKHQELSHYVYGADGASVVDAIFEIVTTNDEVQLLFCDAAVTEKIELCQYLLQPRWYYGGVLDEIHIDKCKKLPIYRTYGGGLSHSFHFSDLVSPPKSLPPFNTPEYFLSGEFIYSSSHNEEEILHRYYGIDVMLKTAFYKQKVLNRICELAPQVRDAVMINILHDLPQLSTEDVSFKQQLRSLEFVPTTGEILRSPQSLYDPRVEELFALLEDSDCFPCGLFQEPNAIDMLRGLGLRTSVSCDTIIESARQIEGLSYKDQLKAHSRSKVLLAYLEVNASKWPCNPSNEGRAKVSKMFNKVAAAFRPQDGWRECDFEKFWNDLRLISWCPVLVTPPFTVLPWPSVSSIVAPPRQVRMQDDLWLVSASMRILDGSCSSSALAFSLGWCYPPPGSAIAAQLLELGKNNEIVTDQVLRQELTLAMPQIYALLVSMIGSDEMDLVKAVLEGSRWIWVGDGFATVDEVVLDGHFHLAPYIRVIPVDLAVFKELFLELGVREFLKPLDFANILCRMVKKKGHTPLNGQELRTAVLVLQQLAELQCHNLENQIYLPDISSRLFPAKDLVYNDAPWLLDSEDDTPGNATKIGLNEKRNVQNFVHGNISNDVAERLGVCSLRRLLLAQSSDSMNLGLSGVAEAFGQHEALTTRLKHIVEMYADGPGILFELVQNAEDAGASEVVFLLDKTQYGTSSTLSPQMAEWQGPALYCFNNSIFSPQDLYAISRIGQDSKLEKPLAIGRFGLGFNCVYHFTDVPGFVSGENIVIFDPHACNLPGVSPSHPGLRIKFVGKRIAEQFPDQFTPFLQFGCDLRHPFPGTLFRFPLRGEVAASRSQIKNEKYAPEDVQSLFSSFSEVVSETLLFLRKINSISVYVKDGLDHEMQLIHSVSRHTVDQSEKQTHPLHMMLNVLHGNQKTGLSKEQFFLKLGKTMDKDLPWHCEKVAVVERNPFSEKSHAWIISECMGGGRARSKSLLSNKRSHNFIPWACVAAYLHTVNVKDVRNPTDDRPNIGEVIDNTCALFQLPASSELDRKEFTGRAFCFLPLPIHTGLPTHINAYFELSSNRRDIWFGNDMAGGGKMRSDWNICLLEDAVAPAYGHLLETIASDFGPCDLFFSFWPTSIGTEPWATMVQKLYRCIADLELRVLYTQARGGQWISTKQAIFPDFTFTKAYELSEALSDAGLPLITLSKPIVERFMDACPSLHYLNPRFLRSLLIRRKRGFRNKDAPILVLEYCLGDMKESTFCDNLIGLPLVPLANGLFIVFSRQGEGERIFLTRKDEYELLKDSLPHLIIDHMMPESVLNKLHDVALSGITNLSLLTCDSLLELFPRILPAEWLHAKQVSWTPNKPGQPSLDWMRQLWRFLKSSCNDLSIFMKWPILPIGNGRLIQLARNSNVIKGDGWSEDLSSLLQNLGCFLLRPDLEIEHPQLKNFVQDATASGILNALRAVAGQSGDILELFINISEGERRELRSFLLQSKWFPGMESHHVDMIKLLPIFESYRSRQTISLTSPIKLLKPEGIPEDLLIDTFVRTESEREKNILRVHLGIREPSKTEFYKNHVLNNMSEFLLQRTVLSTIFFDVKILIEEDISMKIVLSETPFVLAANGVWQCPSRLYDPRVPGLQKLLHKESFFPCEKFLNTEMLDTLVSLGLRRTLGFVGLLDSAISVSMLRDSADVNALQYGRRLLFYLNALGSRLSESVGEESQMGTINFTSNREESDLHLKDSHSGIHEVDIEFDWDELSCLGNVAHNEQEDGFWAEMRTVAWCPVYVNPPIQGLPWFTSGCQVASPNITRPMFQMWMVSSTMRILDGECPSTYLHKKLGWTDPIDIQVLSVQLVELSKAYLEVKLCSDLEPLHTELQREIPKLYSKLQEVIGTGEFSVLENALDGVPWVWVGDNFVSPKALAFDSPVKYHPYLYVVPSELCDFRVLLAELGVKLTFDVADYLCALRRLQHDLSGKTMSNEQLSFVHCVLEAIAECSLDKPLSHDIMSSILMPDSVGNLMHSVDLVYNDAPWMDQNNPATKKFLHPSISEDLARRLGVQSLRCLSLVDDEMMMELPCMDYPRLCDLLALYGDSHFLFFDLLELADCCKAKKVHLIYDKREHPRHSLLQHNLGEFQGPSLLVVMEGASLSREEICNLQFPPPWNLKGTPLNYGLGLLSCHFVCDLLSIVSSGYLYMFDPLGLALAPPSNHNPSAKMFSLIGTNLTKRFQDQFHPMLISDDMSLLSSDSTIIRMPLSSKYVNEGESGCKRIKQIFDRFIAHASSALLFLKSVLQVSVSTWEKDSPEPQLDFSVSIDPSSAVIRNPFAGKKWRKFHISRLFSSSSAAIKLHVIDLHVFQEGVHAADKWLTALSLGSGQTRNMALDRQYLSYNLTPVAGVAVHLSRDGQPIYGNSSSCILCPLPLSGDISMPVTALGCFLVCHNGGRYLFSRHDDTTHSNIQIDKRYKLIEAWNRELMSCIRDSYVELVLEFQKMRRNPSASSIELNSARALSPILQAYGDRIYLFWPRSKERSSNKSDDDTLSFMNTTVADWLCLVEQVIQPFYVRLVDLPVWQLYHGELVKANEGMFLCQSSSGNRNDLPPERVCNFIREHYPVFSVPSELVSEIQAVGVKVREIKPKMVRDLLKSSPSILLHSLETYMDVLDYSLSDIPIQLLSNLPRDTQGENTSLDQMQNTHFQNPNMLWNGRPSSSNSNSRRSHRTFIHNTDNPGNDALEIVSSLGKALYDFGRGVVEDIGRAGGPSVPTSGTRDNVRDSNLVLSIVGDLKGMPFPTANMNLARLGLTELWVGSGEQQFLMHQLVDKFVHPQCLERPILTEFLSSQSLHGILKLQLLNPYLLSTNLRFLFSENWVNRLTDSKRTPWFNWRNRREFLDAPTAEWIQLFWKVFKDLNGDVSLVNDWPLIPAFLGNPVLCRARYYDLVFVPPISEPIDLNGPSTMNSDGNEMLDPVCDNISEIELMKLYLTSFEMIKSEDSWLLALLNQFNIPVYDMSFMNHGAPRDCFPVPGQRLGHVIAGKLLAAKHANLFCKPEPFPAEDRDRLFTLLATDFNSSNGSVYTREELDMLTELPIYKTTLGSYTELHGHNHCIISSSGFFRPINELCLVSSEFGVQFLHALGVQELHDQEVLIRFALPGFEGKTLGEREDILIYLHTNWGELQLNSAIVNTLKETKFVRSAVEHCEQLFKPCDLLDPCDKLLSSVFAGERIKFPGERFITDGWLQILRKTGLRTSSEADTIVECARKVELLGKEASIYSDATDDLDPQFFSAPDGISSEVWSLAESVVVRIFANFSVLFDSKFCDVLSKITFIPAEKGFPNIGGKKGGKRVLCSYTEAILLKDWPLAWSCAPILAKGNVIPPEFSWGAFHLRSPPAFPTVLKHLQMVGKNNGEDTLAHWPMLPDMLTVEDAACEVLKYLDRIWGSLSSSDMSELQKVPFLPVANGTRLAMATSLFVRLTINLSPFAFELSACYLPYVKVLKDIGIQDFLTVSYAEVLLSNIQSCCGYQHLNPNELRAVMEILHFICDDSSARLDGLDWLSDAIVPDDGCRLVLARSCVYIDAYGSKFLSNIDSSRLRFVHPELPKKICTALDVKKLSDIIIEEVDDELLVVNGIRSVTVKNIADKLLSRSLQEAIWVVVSSLVDQMPSLEDLSMEKLQSSLVTVSKNLQFVQKIYTRFLLLPKHLDVTRITITSVIPEWNERSRHRAVYFVNKPKTRILIAEPPSHMSIYDVLAIVVSQVLGMPVTLPIGSLLSCPDKSEKAIVNILRLGSETGIPGCKEKNNILLGKELLPQDALQVQFHPLRPFYMGEIVAWRMGKDGEKLKYGRIPQDVRPSAGQTLYRFVVETAPGETQPLLSSQVFSFSSVSMADGPFSSVQAIQVNEENKIHEQANKGAGSSKSAGQNAVGSQFGRVTAAELVQAVHDMLSAAGIDMNAEKQTLLETTLTLQERVEAAQVALLVEQEKADLAAKEADTAKAAWSCRICLTAEVSITIIPCGHVLCLRCSSAVSRCPFCRTQVSKTVKIYRP